VFAPDGSMGIINALETVFSPEPWATSEDNTANGNVTKRAITQSYV
jgi:hypothetical protein